MMRLTSLEAPPTTVEKLPPLKREAFVEDLFGLVRSDRRTSYEIAYLAAVSITTIDKWRDKDKAPISPRVHTIVAVARLYGYTVALAKTSSKWN